MAYSVSYELHESKVLYGRHENEINFSTTTTKFCILNYYTVVLMYMYRRGSPPLRTTA